MKHDLRSIARQFQIRGEFVSAEPYGNGHINDTYCAMFDVRGLRSRYIFQRVNHRIFRNPVALMENIQRVTLHLRRKLAGEPDSDRRVPTLTFTQEERPFHCDVEGNFWRAQVFIDRAHTRDTVETPEQACEAAKAFGRFQKMLADLPPPRLHDTIPEFHNTPKRVDALEKAIAGAMPERAIIARPEIDFALARRSMADDLLNAGLPERVAHNDAKINNVMLDNTTGEGICVIDLDTVMPGFAHYDFGELVRTMTSPAAEDERNLDNVAMRFPIFQALSRGYMEQARDFLTPAERNWLVASGKLITYENGVRFLTDYLDGDTYYKIRRENHNLDRCRAQFKLVASIEEQETAMNEFIESLGD